MEFLQSIAGKVVTSLVVLAVLAAGISWWQTDPATRHAILSGTGRVFVWLLGVSVWPWVTFGLIGRVAKMQSNLAGGLLVATYTLLEVIMLAWLFSWNLPNATVWSFVGVGGLIAAAYNVLACDWIAEKVQ